jgi:hypothetical protein
LTFDNLDRRQRGEASVPKAPNQTRQRQEDRRTAASEAVHSQQGVPPAGWREAGGEACLWKAHGGKACVSEAHSDEACVGEAHRGEAHRGEALYT